MEIFSIASKPTIAAASIISMRWATPCCSLQPIKERRPTDMRIHRPPYGEICRPYGRLPTIRSHGRGSSGVYQEGDGLYNMRTRHYDASTARFLSRDDYQSPEPASSEPYSYAKANPLLYISILWAAAAIRSRESSPAFVTAL